ncbi:MAG: enoyl-CoA hydratase/isomerase family protein [Bacteroidetes bacterium]|nr:enoyl-CoA hydratase/isomerase family protein [Bacteroidota bacterium]
MSFIIYEKTEGIAKIVFNRADKFNSFCREMALDFQAALDDAAADESIRCVYITGEGKAFCAGQDLSEAIDDNGIELSQIVSEHYNPIIEKMRNIAKPVVCAINGVAAGAGANIALAGDIVVAADTACFIQAFSKIGLVPDSGGTYFLPRLVGFQKASALMMLGDKVMADEAEHLGMIYKVYPQNTFADESWKLALTLAQMPTQGLALTKTLLNHSYANSLNDQLLLEGKLQIKASETHDYREGVNAFLEKRKAVFLGK